MAATSALVAAMIALTAAIVAFTAAFTPATVALAAALAACAAFCDAFTVACAVFCAVFAACCVVLIAVFVVLTDLCAALAVPFPAVLMVFLPAELADCLIVFSVCSTALMVLFPEVRTVCLFIDSAARFSRNL